MYVCTYVHTHIHMFRDGKAKDGVLWVSTCAFAYTFITDVYTGGVGWQDAEGRRVCFNMYVYIHTCNVQVASVGKTEEEVKAMGIEYRKGTFPFVSTHAHIHAIIGHMHRYKDT
jgi:hypothetical protein